MKPPKLPDLNAGTQLVAGMSVATVHADFDFETYSPVDLMECGAQIYTEHPDAEVLSLAYDLKDGNGIRVWIPPELLPEKKPYKGLETPFYHFIRSPFEITPWDLFKHLENGYTLEAHNISFEYLVWENICVRRYGWPSLKPHILQLRCSAAKARAFALPGSLDKLGEVLNISCRKDKDGARLIKKFCCPRTPTKNDDRTRILPSDDPQDFNRLIDYNIRDIEAEAEVSSLIPDLNEFELAFWQADQRINRRGIAIDLPTVDAAIEIIEQLYERYNAELSELTGGTVTTAAQTQRILTWAATQGVTINNLQKNNIDELLDDPEKLPLNVYRVLELREMLAGAAVKKLYAMKRRAASDGRVHDLFIYHGARTGRATGSDLQPQNLPSAIVNDIVLCEDCVGMFKRDDTSCLYCGNDTLVPEDWGIRTIEEIIHTVSDKNLDILNYYWGDPGTAIKSIIRSMIIAAPGHDLICADYSAIESVVLAAIAGEEWRLEVFRTHGKIYEASASKITGIPLAELIEHERITGKHHPARKLGKTSELASGYQGFTGAWKAFGADKFMTEQEIINAASAWRDASPKIVALWAGLENAAKSAVIYANKIFSYAGIEYEKRGDALYCKLPSGRYLTYHRPRIAPGARGDALSYEGWNTNIKYGAPGWVRIDTYGGKLTENVVQAAARDLLAYAILNLEVAGYPVVLHVHDEIVCEIPELEGDLRKFESIMSSTPPWAAGWPVRVGGGWRGKRYRK